MKSRQIIRQSLSFLSLIFISGLLITTSVQAAVSLERTIKADGKSLKFGNIASIAVNHEGNLLVVDSELGTVTTFKGNKFAFYTLSGKGKAFSSRSINSAVFKDKNSLIVGNNDDDSIVEVSAKGELIKKLVTSGGDEGQLNNPGSIAWSANRRLYVANTGNGRVSIFGDDGVFIQSISGRSGETFEPVQVFVDSQERIYVLETRDDGIVSVYKHDGSLIKRLNADNIKKITGSEPELAAMAIDDTGLVYLADNNSGRIYQINWDSRKMLASFGSKGRQRGQFEKITGLAVLPDGQVAVADSFNKKIEIYRLPATGRQVPVQKRLPTVGYERSIKMNCNVAYRLQGGSSLCLDDEGNKASVYSRLGKLQTAFKGVLENPVAASVDDQNVAILDGDSLKIYRLDGGLRYTSGSSGSDEGKFDSPQGVFFHGDKIYIADTGNQRIQIFSKDGIFLEHISNPEKGRALFDEPSRVVVDANNNMYVLENASNQVLVFSPDRKLLYRIDGRGGASQGFEAIYDIAVDSDNNLYVLAAIDGNKSTVQVYNGPNKVIAMGASAAQGSGMLSPSRLSIAPSRKTVVSVYDRERKALLNYKYMQLPAKLGGLVVDGAIEQTRLSWKKVPGSYVSRYKVYGAPNKTSEFKFLADVGVTEAVIKHEQAARNFYYRVSAVSGFSVEGEQSNVRDDDFQIGYAHYRNKDYAKAEAIFSKSYQQNSGHGEVLKYLGLSAMELGKVDTAVGYFRELTMLPGYEAEGLNYQIKALVGMEDYVAAKAIVDKVIADNTASTDTIVYCGELSLIMGDAVGAEECLSKALKKEPKNVKAHFLMGKAYIKLGIVKEGIAEFRKAVSINKRDADVWYQAGVVYTELKKYKSADACFRNAIKLRPGFNEARLALAKNYLDQKQYDKVKNIALKLAGNAETAAKGQYLLGLTAFATGQDGQALLALTKSTRADPSNAAAWLALIDVYIKMGQNEKVRDALVSAVKGDEKSFAAAYRLGELDFDAQNYAESARSLEMAVKLKPDHYGARYKLAYAQYRNGAYQQADNHAASAVKLEPKNFAPLALQASIANKQGKTGKAIDLIRRAMGLKKNSATLYTTLGSFYADNSLFDQAKAALDKASTLDTSSAKPYLLLGALYSKRRLFDQSIKAYDKAVKLNPSPENQQALDAAYAEKKRSMEFGSNAPQLALNDLRLDKIFSAAYKQYSKKPIGYVNVQNVGSQNYNNLKLTFSVKGFMDFPSTKEIPVLNAGSTLKVPLYATFNNRVLDIDEDTGVQTEVAVQYTRDGRKDSIKVTQPMTIYGKNAIVWGQPNMVGSFVTPKDDVLRDFVRQAYNENKPEADVINSSLLTAMTMFDVFTAHGIRYVVDPNSPYSNLSETSVDYVQFSRETLKFKSGDCDDLSVLMSTALENLGVETAILDVPGHLLMMFNTGVSQAERHQVSANDELLVIRKGQVWIPVEATMIGTTFLEAWSEGARKYHEHAANKKLTVIPMRTAWSEFTPVTLKPAGYTLVVPDKSQVAPIIVREKNLILKKSLDNLVAPYRAMVKMDPTNAEARMQVAIIYARHGLYSAAEKEFDEILDMDPDNSAVYNNRGNIYFNKKDFERAIESYAYAEQLASNDAGVKMNLSMAHYKLGDLQMANSKYKEARRIDSAVNTRYAGFIKLLNQ